MEADFTQPDMVEQWQSIQNRLRADEMPPEDQPRPDAKQAAAVIQWIDARLVEVAARRKAEGRTVLRRLNRVEYQNTVRDLLGVDVDVKDLLPEDPVAFGFDNVGAALNISPLQLERYLEAADRALDAPWLPVPNRRPSASATRSPNRSPSGGPTGCPVTSRPCSCTGTRTPMGRR